MTYVRGAGSGKRWHPSDGFDDSMSGACTIWMQAARVDTNFSLNVVKPAQDAELCLQAAGVSIWRPQSAGKTASVG